MGGAKLWSGKGTAEENLLDVKPRHKYFSILAVIFVLSTSCIAVFYSVDERMTLSLLELTNYYVTSQPAQPTLSNLTDSHMHLFDNGWHNLLVEESSNYTATLAMFLHSNSTNESGCYGVPTNKTKLEFQGRPSSGSGTLQLQTDVMHQLTLVSYAENETRRCAGGDYFEVDFHDHDNLTYRSRLPTVDFGNGSYGLYLKVPSRFAGNFVLDIWLLFSNWHGMDNVQYGPKSPILALTQEIEMLQPGDWSIQSSSRQGSRLSQCVQSDFDRTAWQGRWTRSWFNESCDWDSEKRYRCLPEDHYWCESPWCIGPVGRLESNGWQYSAHCSFKIFQNEEAWRCLNGKRLLTWGDSNFQDTLRNLLLFIVDWNLPSGKGFGDFGLERTFEMDVVHPNDTAQSFHLSQLFNGAHIVHQNGEGLRTLMHKEHQEILQAHFNGTNRVDAVIMNSGLHDGFGTVELYAAKVNFTIHWWMQLYDSIPADRKPQLIWRTTVAPAGSSRTMGSSPNKMEMYNLIVMEKFREVHDRLPVKFIDAFDLTFPFHYTHEFSDGGHYGRAPGTNHFWYGHPHHYFVDIMLAHIILNVVCQ